MSPNRTDKPPAAPGPTRRRSGPRAPLLAVGVAGVLIGAGLALREGTRPIHGQLRALRSADLEARREAARGLVGLPLADARLAIPALDAALGDPDELADMQILLDLAEAGTTAARDPGARAATEAAAGGIVRALGDPRAPIRAQAAIALEPFAEAGAGPPPYDSAAAASALARMALADPEPSARAAATRALLAVAPRATAPAPAELAAALTATDRPVAIRGLAAALLGAFPVGRREAVAPLAAALGDGDPWVRWGAAVGLSWLGPDDIRPALPALLAVLAEPLGDPARYDGSGPALAWTPSAPRPVVIERIVQSSPPDPPAFATRDPARMAAVAAGVAGSGQGAAADAAVDALARMLAAEQPWRREAASEVLGRLGPRAVAAVPALIRALEAAIPDPATPEALASGLTGALARVAPGGPHAPAAVGALAHALASPSASLGYWSAFALGEFGAAGAPALPRLREIARTRDKRTADLANEAIAAIAHPPTPGRHPDPGTTGP